MCIFYETFCKQIISTIVWSTRSWNNDIEHNFALIECIVFKFILCIYLKLVIFSMVFNNYLRDHVCLRVSFIYCMNVRNGQPVWLKFPTSENRTVSNSKAVEIFNSSLFERRRQNDSKYFRVFLNENYDNNLHCYVQSKVLRIPGCVSKANETFYCKISYCLESASECVKCSYIWPEQAVAQTVHMSVMLNTTTRHYRVCGVSGLQVNKIRPGSNIDEKNNIFKHHCYWIELNNILHRVVIF